MPSLDRDPLLLAVDDEPGMLAMIKRVAENEGFTVVTFSDGLAAIAYAASSQPDLVLVDLQMPEIGGLEVIRALRSANPGTRVALMTGHASMDSAVEAIKLGAIDYLTKPFDIARLKETLGRVTADSAQRERVEAAEAEMATRFEFNGMIGHSPAMRELFDLLNRLAPHVRSALITGETGTGKELAAKALHQLGPRRAKRFIPVNCSAIVESLFESELFGHVRGAFTGAIENKTGMFEAADGGTLFLDEIGELPLMLQAKLLRVLESGEITRVGSSQPRHVDVRVIAATNRDLRVEVAAGRFREDLYYRLNIAQIHLPPLRQRVADIALLTTAFLRDFAHQFKKPALSVTPGAAAALERYPWPGNIRELRNVLERATLVAERNILTEEDIGLNLSAGASSAPSVAPKSIVPTLTAVEQDHIAKVIETARGNKSEAARRLGISRRALYRRLGKEPRD